MDSDTRRSVRAYAVPLLVYLVLGITWALTLPLWQGPDEPGHYEYAALLAELGRPPRPQDAQPELQATILRSMAAHRFWALTFQQSPTTLPTRFVESTFLRRSGSQLGNEHPAYYILPAFIVRSIPSVESQMYLIRLYSVLLGSGVVLAAVWGARRTWPTVPLLRDGLPLAVALLPMPTFLHATVNSTVLVDVLGAWFFALGWQVVRASPTRPIPRWRWVLWLALALTAAWVKRTAIGLVVIALVVMGWRIRAVRRVMVGVFGLGVVLLTLTMVVRVEHRADRWHMNPQLAPAPRDPTGGWTGTAALRLVDRLSSRRIYAAQNVEASHVPTLWGESVTFEVLARAIERPTLVCLSVIDEQHHTFACGQVVPTRWQRLQVIHEVTPGTAYVRVVVGIGRPQDWTALGAAWVDNARLIIRQTGQEVLHNGDVEQAARALAVIPHPWRRWLPALDAYVYVPPLVEPGAVQRWVIAAGVFFVSFWGNFGWLQYPLPWPIYGWLVGITVLAIVGYGRRWQQAQKDERPLLTFHAGALLLGIITLLLPTLWSEWMPQGRYLFPWLLPAVAVYLEGGRMWVPSPARERLLGRALLVTGVWFSLFALVWTLAAMYGTQ